MSTFQKVLIGIAIGYIGIGIVVPLIFLQNEKKCNENSMKVLS